MKRNFSCVLALSALILTAGCKKSINSSVDLTNGAKASFMADPNWQLPGINGRIIRYDIGDGLYSDCLLAYDMGLDAAGGTVSLVKFSGTTSTLIYRNYQGFQTNVGFINAAQNTGDIGDNYNEVGGMHIIPYDATGNGHEDHLLLYIPGEGEFWVIHWNGTGWIQDAYNNTGIGGYDLLSKYDKIIAYDYGSGYKNYLICYRPGSGLVWVLKNNSGTGLPFAFSTVQSSAAGIGGFDFEGQNDQLVCIGGPSSGNMNLAAYRPGPGLGYVWFINHNANSTSFSPVSSTRSGLNGWGFNTQDRIAVAYSGGGVIVHSPENDQSMMTYEPGSGPTINSLLWTYTLGLSTEPSPQGINGVGVLTHNPYGSPATYEGDHIVYFSGNGQSQNNSMFIYRNGGGTQSQLYYSSSPNGVPVNYTQVY